MYFFLFYLLFLFFFIFFFFFFFFIFHDFTWFFLNSCKKKHYFFYLSETIFFVAGFFSCCPILLLLLLSFHPSFRSFVHVIVKSYVSRLWDILLLSRIYCKNYSIFARIVSFLCTDVRTDHRQNRNVVLFCNAG